MSDQLEAILQLANTPALKSVLRPHIYEADGSVGMGIRRIKALFWRAGRPSGPLAGFG
jgi:hypothetical protein